MISLILVSLWFEPAHEIMALFVLHKLILQTHMPSHPVGLDVWFLVRPFVYFHTSCVRTAKALARLRRCAGSPQLSLVAYVISTIISWAGSFQNWDLASDEADLYLRVFRYFEAILSIFFLINFAQKTLFILINKPGVLQFTLPKNDILETFGQIQDISMSKSQYWSHLATFPP